MTQQEQRRMHLLTQVQHGRVQASVAAQLLGLSVRHLRRLLARFRQHGLGALAHGNRGRPSPRRLSEAVRARILTLAHTRYAGVNADHHRDSGEQDDGRHVERRHVWYMNQAQARSGARYRGAVAMAAAEAGVHRALSILESSAGSLAPDGGPGRTWRAQAHTETLAGVSGGAMEARFTIDVVDADGGVVATDGAVAAGGAVVVTSTGEVAGVRRRIRARVVLASPALLAAIYGTSVVRMEPRAATYILPYRVRDGAGPVPWVHIAAGRGLWFSTRGVAINEPSGSFDTGSGPVDAPVGAASLPQPDRLRLLLARSADLVTEPDLRRTELYRLRTLGAYVDGEVRRAETFPAPPEIDRAYWKAAARANTANADLNRAAGEYLLDSGLRHKPDSVYTQREFTRVLDYLATGRWAERWVVARGRATAGFAGVVYVTGEVTLGVGRHVHISDGTLVAEDSVTVGDRAGLQITHTAATRALPGLIVLDPGRLAVGRAARLDVHGLVYAGRVFDAIYGAQVHIVGSVIGADPVISFNNLAATVVIRYDPAVLGTPGLKVPDGSPVVAWVAAWEDRP